MLSRAIMRQAQAWWYNTLIRTCARCVQSTWNNTYPIITVVVIGQSFNFAQLLHYPSHRHYFLWNLAIRSPLEAQYPWFSVLCLNKVLFDVVTSYVRKGLMQILFNLFWSFVMHQFIFRFDKEIIRKKKLILKKVF